MRPRSWAKFAVGDFAGAVSLPREYWGNLRRSDGERFEISLSQMLKIVFKSTIGVIGVNDLSFMPS